MANLPKYKENSKYLDKKSIPKNASILLLVNTKEDAKLINSTSNELGVFAIPTHNKENSQLKHTLKAIKTRFKEAFVLGIDNTYQERKKSYNMAKNWGLIWVNTLMAKNYLNIPKDLHLFQWVDTLEPNQKEEKLKQFLMFCIGSNHKIRSYQDDPSSIEVSHCYKLHFEQYIGQTTPNQFGITPVDFMQEMIKEYDRVMLQANAGAGKTTLTQLLVHQQIIQNLVHQNGKDQEKTITTPNLNTLRKNAGIERVIIAVPTNAIGTQLLKDFQARGLHASLLDNQSTRNDIIGAEYSNVIISCYDSVRKVPHLIDKKTLVIIDEFHQLSIDIEYRNRKAFRYLIGKIENARKTLFISATPNYFYALDQSLDQSFGFTLVKGIPTVQNKIDLLPIIYEGRRKDLLGYVIENSPEKEGATLCKFDSISNLKIAHEVLTRLNLPSEFLCSRLPSQKQDNKTYNSIMETGFFKYKLYFLLYTTLMEAGVSIKEQVRLNALIDTIGWQKAIQLIARPRYNHKTGVNKQQTVWLFKSKKNLTENTEILYKQPIVKRFVKMKELAETVCQHLNSGSYGDFKSKTESDPRIHYLITYYDEEEEEYKPCILYILRLMYEQSLKVPFSMTLKRIERFDNRITILPYKEIKVEPHPIFEEIREVYKEENKKKLQELEKLFLTDFNVLVASICHKNRDIAYKDKISALFDGVADVHKMQIKHFLLTHENLLTGDKPKKILDNIYFLCDYNKTLKVSEVARMVIDTGESTLKMIKSQIGRNNRAFDFDHNLNDSRDRQAHLREQTILKKLSQMIRDDRRGRSSKSKGWRTPRQYQKAINNAIAKCTDAKGKKLFTFISEGKALAIIKDLYHVDKIQIQVKKKRVWHYQLISKRTIQETNELIYKLIEESNNTDPIF